VQSEGLDERVAVMAETVLAFALVFEWIGLGILLFRSLP
jgi:hypothetical protein